MAEYINKEDAIDALMAVVEDNRDDQFGGEIIHYTGVKAMLECLPAADVVERKRGKWIHQNPPDDWVMSLYVCDQCGHLEEGEPNYCPCCGAYMRGNMEEEP